MKFIAVLALPFLCVSASLHAMDCGKSEIEIINRLDRLAQGASAQEWTKTYPSEPALSLINYSSGVTQFSTLTGAALRNYTYFDGNQSELVISATAECDATRGKWVLLNANLRNGSKYITFGSITE